MIDCKANVDPVSGVHRLEHYIEKKELSGNNAGQLMKYIGFKCSDDPHKYVSESLTQAITQHTALYSTKVENKRKLLH